MITIRFDNPKEFYEYARHNPAWRRQVRHLPSFRLGVLDYLGALSGPKRERAMQLYLYLSQMFDVRQGIEFVHRELLSREKALANFRELAESRVCSRGEREE